MSDIIGSARALSRQPSPPVPELKAAIKGLLNYIEQSRPAVDDAMVERACDWANHQDEPLRSREFVRGFLEAALNPQEKT